MNSNKTMIMMKEFKLNHDYDTGIQTKPKEPTFSPTYAWISMLEQRRDEKTTKPDPTAELQDIQGRKIICITSTVTLYRTPKHLYHHHYL